MCTSWLLTAILSFATFILLGMETAAWQDLLMNYIQHYFSFPVPPVRATERKGYIHAFYESKEANTTAAMSNFLFNEAANYMKEAVKAAEQLKQSPKKGNENVTGN